MINLQASSSVIEREFSTIKDILTAKRNRTSDSRVLQLLKARNYESFIKIIKSDFSSRLQRAEQRFTFLLKQSKSCDWSQCVISCLALTQQLSNEDVDCWLQPVFADGIISWQRNNQPSHHQHWDICNLQLSTFCPESSHKQTELAPCC